MAFSESYIQHLTSFLEVEGRKWIAEYIAGQKAVQARRNIKASGQLAQSMEADVQSRVDSAIRTTIELAFEEYGRIIEMKRLNLPPGGGELIEGLAEWIVKKGFLQRFSQGFLRKRKLKTPPQNIQNQIAWGIAIKRSKNYRRRAWYTKSKSAAVTDLYNRVAAGMPDIVVDEIKKAFAA